MKQNVTSLYRFILFSVWRGSCEKLGSVRAVCEMKFTFHSQLTILEELLESNCLLINKQADRIDRFTACIICAYILEKYWFQELI